MLASSAVESRDAAADGDEGIFDPFKRRSCRPKILWSVGQNSPTRPPSGGGGGAAGDGGVEEEKSATGVSGNGGANGGGGGGAAGGIKAAGGAPAASGMAPAAVAAAAEAGAQPGGGLQNMHSFGGIDIMEAGRAALEKRMNAVQARAAPRGESKLTLDMYLQKARVDA